MGVADGWDRVGPVGDRANTSMSHGESHGAPVVWGVCFGPWGARVALSGSGRGCWQREGPLSALPRGPVSRQQGPGMRLGDQAQSQSAERERPWLPWQLFKCRSISKAFC